MLTGGYVTVYVSDMDRAVKFYSEILGLRLAERYGNHWASVDAGGGLRIGLHPASAQNPAGHRGSIAIGFGADGPIERVVEELEKRGVQLESGIVNDNAGKFVSFSDPEGNACYIYELHAQYQPKPVSADAR
jgi:catechol 2,3-dioxygenase-like lactoylglutathione lyase family enzyme